MSGERPPRRVRVTRSVPYRAAQEKPQARTSATENTDDAEADPVVGVYDADLRRTVLRWAAAVLAVVAIPLFGLPLVLLAVPGLASSDIAGIPVPWLLLGIAVYPLVWLASRWFVAGAERTERDYVEGLGGDSG